MINSGREWDWMDDNEEAGEGAPASLTTTKSSRANSPNSPSFHNRSLPYWTDKEYIICLLKQVAEVCKTLPTPLYMTTIEHTRENGYDMADKGRYLSFNLTSIIYSECIYKDISI